MKTNSWTTAGQAKDISSSPNPSVKVLQRGCHWVWGPNRRRAIKEWSIAINNDWVDNLTFKTPRKPASENVVCLSSAEYSCKLSKPIFAYRQIVWTQIRLLLKEQSDLGQHCLQKWLLKSQADDMAVVIGSLRVKRLV